MGFNSAFKGLIKSGTGSPLAVSKIKKKPEETKI